MDFFDRFLSGLRDILDAIGRWLKGLLDRFLDFLNRPAPGPGTPPGPAPKPPPTTPPSTGPYGSYDRSKWRWDSRRRRWVLKESERVRKGYNCSEYCIARIEGRAPRWGGDESRTTETHEVEQKLVSMGWHRGDGECNCGTGQGQTKDCVVVYFCQGQVVHVAILDKTRGDWGGKTSAGGPIVRYRRPVDYFEEGSVPTGCEMRFYCPTTPLSGTQKSDEWLHDNAQQL